MDLWSRISLTRRVSHKRITTKDISGPSSPVRPILDTDGFVAIRYSDTPTSSNIATPSSQKSESIFGDATGSTARPDLPQRHSSRRTTRSSGERPFTPSSNDGKPPPIPPKSPYRASRAMVELQRRLAEEREEQVQFFEEDESDRWSVRTI